MGRPGGALRTLSALTAALFTLLAVLDTGDLGAARSAVLGSGALVRTALELELGPAVAEGPGGWAELVVDQSPLLAGEKEAVEALRQEARSVAAPEPEAEPEPVEPEASESGAGEESAPERVPENDAQSGNAAQAPSAPAQQKQAPKRVRASDIQVENDTSRQKPQVKKYWSKKLSLKLKPASEGPQILILHTHATEAYTMADGDNYEESDPTRTTDERFNVIRVGEEMKKTFEEMGLSVLHDKTTYDYPGYSGSYARSLAGAQAYLDQYPTIQVVLDVHRDAIIDRKGRVYDRTAVVDGEEAAQVMLVVGSNESGLKHPHWRRNYTLALKLQAAMLEQQSGLARPIDLRAQRFNQHLRSGSLLVEVGTSGNTLRQALAGARRFARSAGGVYLGCVEQ